MELVAEPLSAEAFAPFGRVLERPPNDADAAGPGWRWWGETALLAGDGRAVGIGYLELTPSEPVFDWAERHLRSTETIVPAAGGCLVYVAPPGDGDESERPAAPLDRFRVFRVPAGTGVVLEPGVWHGAPLALGGPARVFVLLLEGTGRDDTTVVRFPETPVRIQL